MRIFERYTQRGGLAAIGFCAVLALFGATSARSTAQTATRAVDQFLIPDDSPPRPSQDKDSQSTYSRPVFLSQRHGGGPGDPALASGATGAGAGWGANPEHPAVPWAAEWNQPKFSRLGIGAGLSPAGLGLVAAIVLNRITDIRGTGNFFLFNGGPVEIEGFRANINVHMASAAASVDLYPHNSMVRLSAGLWFYNGNQVALSGSMVGGTEFTVNGQNYWSATANPATGAMPLTGSGVLGLNRNKIAPSVTFGFGRFIPRSNRHWSFPSEFGVAFTGAPTANISTSGWVCQDKAQTQCADVNSPGNPVGVNFNGDMRSSLAKWRNALGTVSIFPIFSSGVVYSFNLR